MALEFDIKLVQPLPLGRLRSGTESLFLEVFSSAVSLTCKARDDLILGESKKFVECLVDDDTVVTLMSDKAGEEHDLGSEGGYWLSVAVDRVRNGRSSVLALLLAAAAARIVGTEVVDEWAILGPQRMLSPDRVVDFVREIAGEGSFEMAVQALAAKLCVSPV